MDITSNLQPGLTIGIAGTAKNTGKTTTTATLMEGLASRGIRLGLTSIGYDGESIDNVTGLPKPRLRFRAGELVATAERCLQSGTAVLKVRGKTPFRTPLGQVVLAEVVRGGLVVLAGPNKSEDLRQVLVGLANLGAQIIMVDGALNRMAPMVETKGLVLATGAARQPDIPLLAAETAALAAMCRLTVIPQAPTDLKGGSPLLIYRNGQAVLEGISSLVDETLATQLVERVTNLITDGESGTERPLLWIPGVITQAGWRCLAERWPSGIRLDLVLPDPVKVMVAGQATETWEYVQTLSAQGVQIMTKNPLPLLAVTVNPFFPRYRYEVHDYEPAYVDATALRRAVADAVGPVVWDVVQNPAGLVNRLLQWMTAR